MNQNSFSVVLIMQSEKKLLFSLLINVIMIGLANEASLGSDASLVF